MKDRYKTANNNYWFQLIVNPIHAIAGVKWLCLIALLAIFPAKPVTGQANTDSVELHGITFFNQIQIGSVDLTLNGFGTRTYGVFKTKIYVAALYLSSKNNDENAILASNTPKQITMQYMRNIDQEDMREGWTYYFKQACPNEDCSAYNEAITRFQSLVIAADKKDRYDYVFHSLDRVDILINDELVGTIEGKNFASLLLSTWIGGAPPTKELKKSLLGKV